MVQKCSIYDCRSRKENLKVSLFSVPQNEDEQKKWCNALGYLVGSASKVCELHFNVEDIIRDNRVIDSGGKEHVVALRKKKLKKGACLFFYDRSKVPPEKMRKLLGGFSHKLYKQSNPSTMNNDASDMKENVSFNIIMSQNDVVNNILSAEVHDKSPITSNAPISFEKNQFPAPVNVQLHNNNLDNVSGITDVEITSTATVENVFETLDDSDIISTVTSNNTPNSPLFAPNSESKTESSSPSLFKNLCTALGTIRLPTGNWMLTTPFESNVFMFSLLDAMPSPSGSKNLVPIFLKQVFVHEDSRIQVRIRDKNVDLQNQEVVDVNLKEIPVTVEDLEMFLQNLDATSICVGGPEISIYKHVNPENAYKDRVIWRHNKCSLICNGTICKSCLGLYKTFPQLINRQQNRKRINRIRIPATPSKGKKIKCIRTRRKLIAQRLTRKEKQLEKVLEELNEVHQRLRNLTDSTFDEQLKRESKNIPENQVLLIRECFADGKKKTAKGRRYNDEWILLCLLLYIRSSAAYNMLRNNNILPLPCKTTITKYLRASDVGFGFDANFFSLFAERLKSLDEHAKNGILSFDEMSVRKSIEVNSKTMTFEGLQDHGETCSDQNVTLDKQADHALVFMFSSLAANFHQPIATFASKGPTTANVISALVLLAIINVEKAGGKVQGIVCDGATTNRSMWKELGISGKINECNFCFENPFDDSRVVYAFSDAPHLIKCIRNRLEEKKYLKVDGQYVKWEYYKALYYSDSVSDLRVCPKLTERHVIPVQSMKMRMSLAVQIFSKSVARGLEHFAKIEQSNPDPNAIKQFEGCEGTIDFSLRINNMFDALNRAYPKVGIKLDSKDFEVLEEAIDWLDKWEHEKESKELFLTDTTAQGLRVTLHSTIHLTKYLLEKCGFSYVLISKMNQDCLEQFFGCIRQAGCQNDHPTLHTFKQLYHLLSMYQILKPPKFGNCSVRENTNETKKITLQQLRDIFPKLKQSYRQEHLNELQKKLDNLVEHDDWECEDMFADDVPFSETEDCVIYYISGFAARKLKKFTKCGYCAKAFISSYENLIMGVKAADLVTLKSEGGLIHPNIHLFQLFRKLEEFFQKYKDNVNVYNLIIEELFKSNYHFTFPCKEHKSEMTSTCILYYVTMRMRQYSKLKNREINKSSQNIKKTAKYYST